MTDRSYAWPAGHWDWYQHLAFKHGIRTGEFIFVGGQVDKDSTGEPQHAWDLEAQTEVVIRHIHTVLGEFGAGLADVVNLVAYHAAPLAAEPALIENIGRHLNTIGGVSRGAGPALSMVPLPCLALPGMLIEIEATVVFGRDGQRLPRQAMTSAVLGQLPDALSHVVRCGNHLWVGSLDAASPGAAAARVALALEQLGADLGDLVKLSAWYANGDASQREKIVSGLAAVFDDRAPVLSAMPSPSLDANAAVRLSGWAVRGGDGTRIHANSTPGKPLWRWPENSPFPHALRSGGIVFLGSHASLDEHGAVCHVGDLNAQTRTTIEYARASLAAFGLSLDHMVKQTSFFLGKARAEDVVTNQTLRSSFYTEPAGASTGVPLPGFSLADVAIDIETIAMEVGVGVGN